MTLVVLGHARQFAFQVSDRRLTGGRRDDDSNKLFIYNAPTCRLIFGFSGLAECGSFRMREWLPNSLRDAEATDPTLMLRQLHAALNTLFKEHRDINAIPRVHRRTTVACNGFIDTIHGAIGAYALLTNYQNFKTGSDDLEAWDEFQVHTRLGDGPANLLSVQRIGMYDLYTPEYITDVKDLLTRDVSPEGVVEKVSSQIRSISADPRSAEGVGSRLMAAWISSDRSIAARFAYLPDAATWEYHAPTIIDASTGVIFRGAVFKAADENATALAVPRQRRKAPCACGSGKKYKRCHGK